MIFPTYRELATLNIVDRLKKLIRKISQQQLLEEASNDTHLNTGSINSSTDPKRRKTLQRYLSDQKIEYGELFYEYKGLALNASIAVLMIEIDNEKKTATLSGHLNSRTPYALYLLTEKFPHIVTLILDIVPGSRYTTSVMDAGILLRNAGLKTEVLHNSHVYSAGTILYWAGHPRKFAPGTTFKDHGSVYINDSTGEESDSNDIFQPYLDDYLSLLSVHPLVTQKLLGQTYKDWVYFTEEDMDIINAE